MDILDKFIEEIKVVCGQNLKSIVLYGSKASGEQTEKHSDYNLLLILEKIKFEDLKLLNKTIKFWIKKGNPAPLLFTMEQLKKSTDVFPIDFLDMKDHNKILYGNNPFENLEIKNTYLRHECEYELKSKLLKLRQAYMLSQNTSDIRKLLINSISAFLIIFRQVVRLYNVVPPIKRLDALKVLSEKTGLNPSIFVTIFNMKQEVKEALKLDPDLVMEEYLKEIEKIVDIVDNL
ncbi:MAG: hypothetical protein A2539_08655 [Elusimicrobia bacterium RIFOXYD2_FULL_34_15]|nr:MAG: hypothetical protein A2539_08655 [Elusimicrobia bacterium RIFOXYD2_FULL_34_15]